MRNILTIIAAIALSCVLGGCGNMDILDYHWTFNRALIKTDGGKWREVELKAWHDYKDSDMIAVETATQVLVTHSANVILIKDKNR